MDLELPEELRLLQSSVRKFVDETLAPHEKEVEEKDEIPRSLIAAMRAGCRFATRFSFPASVWCMPIRVASLIWSPDGRGFTYSRPQSRQVTA